MSYHGSNIANAGTNHYLGGDSVPPRLVARVLGGGGVTFHRASDVGSYGRYGTGLGVDKEALKAAKAAAFRGRASNDAGAAEQGARSAVFKRPASITKNSAGKVVVPTTSLWSDWNKSAAEIMSPFAGIINSLPSGIVPQSMKNKLKNAPLDALLDIFDPIEARIGRAVDRVLAKKGNTQNYFGKSKNIKRVQSVDLKADASTQNLMRSLRTIDAFIVLFFTQPIELAIECLKEGINIAGDAAGALMDTAQNIANAVGKVANDVMKAGAEAAAEVASWFGFSGLGGLNGLGVVAVDDAAVGAAAVGTTAAVGAGAEVTLASILTLITGLITAAAPIVAGGMALIPKPDAAKPGAGTASDPVKIVPTATTFAPPSGGGGGGGLAPASGGIPPIAIFGGAAVLAFLVLQKKGSRK